MLAQGREKSGESCDIPHLFRYRSSIKVRAKGDVINSDALSNIINVTYQVRQREISLEPAVGAQIIDGESDPHYPV